jgi:hypothetical protein
VSDYEFYNGFPPYTSGSETSMEAAARQLPTAATRRQEVYLCVWRAGQKGLTDEEIAEELNIQIDTEGQCRMPWNYNTVGPRRRELVHQGRIEDSGSTRVTSRGCRAVIWRTAVK